MTRREARFQCTPLTWDHGRPLPRYGGKVGKLSAGRLLLATSARSLYRLFRQARRMAAITLTPCKGGIYYYHKEAGINLELAVPCRSEAGSTVYDVRRSSRLRGSSIDTRPTRQVLLSLPYCSRDRLP